MSAVKCPLTVILLALLHFAVGVVFIVTAPVAVFFAFQGPPTQSAGPSPPVQTASYQALSLCQAAVTFYAAVLLVAAGIGLIRVRRWAWTTSIAVSVLAAFTFIVSRLGLVVIAMFGAGQEVYWLSLIFGSVILCFPQVVHPLLTFAILLPRPNRELFLPPDPTSTPKLPSDSSRFVKGGEEPDKWFCRVGGKVFGPMTRRQMDDSVAEGRIRGGHELWQGGRQSIWARDLYPQLQSSLPPGLRWLFYGPALAPYRPSGSYGGGGWKWAFLLATAIYTTILLVMISLTTRFSIAMLPYLVMGIGSLLAGTFAMAAVLFEWRWFFENRQVRGMRKLFGDRGARWFYLALTCFVLLLGYGLLGFFGVRSLDRDRLASLTSSTVAQVGGQGRQGPQWPQNFAGERSAQCGGVGGGGFERFDPEHRAVLGFRYELGNWDQQDVIRTIHPLYDRANDDEATVLARAGYQVVGLIVDSNAYVNAVQVVFARVESGAVELEDTYTSDWIGIPSGRTPQKIGCDERRVVGIFGRQGLITNALGLLLLPSDSAELPPSL